MISVKKIIIIGGGISGLSSGIYAQMKGFDSIILEKHAIAGGECTGWDRNGYHIDGCIHWLIGTKKGTLANKLWKEVGALDGIDIYEAEAFLVYNYKGTRIVLYRDLIKLQKHLLALSPEDTAIINEFCEDIKGLNHSADFAEKPIDLMSPIEILKTFSAMEAQGKIMKKYGKMTFPEFAQKFKHPGIKEMFNALSIDDLSIAMFMMGFGNFVAGNAGIPKGGSRAFALRMEDKYIKLGGKLQKNCGVKEILIEKGLAKGVVLENGTTVYGDYIIASCDPRVTFDHLLKGNYSDRLLKKRYENPKDYKLFSSIYISLSVDAPLEDHPRSEFLTFEPFSIHNETIDTLSFTNYSYEESFAPKGKTVVTTPINVPAKESYDYWLELSKDQEAYKKEKLRIATAVIKGFEQNYPKLKGKVNLLDVATPVTFHRYAGAYQGAYMPFFLTINSKMMFYHNGKIKGLKKCYLSGQWTMDMGGLPGALLSGKETLQRICKKEKVAW